MSKMKAFKKLLETATVRPWLRSADHVYASGERGANICSISEPRARETVGYSELGFGGPDRLEAYANAELLTLAANHVEALVAQLARAAKILATLRGFPDEVEEATALLASIEEAAKGEK